MTVELYRQQYEQALATAQRRVAAFVSTLHERGAAAVLARSQQTSFDYVLDVAGCNPDEIKLVRSRLSAPLPEAVEAFLIVMGRRTASIDVGVDCRYQHILEGADAYQDWLDEVAAAEYDWYVPSAFVIPEDALILGHHGGGFFYFLVDRVPDPIVWCLSEGPVNEGNGIRASDLTFSQVVLRSIERAAADFEPMLHGMIENLGAGSG